MTVYPDLILSLPLLLLLWMMINDLQRSITLILIGYFFVKILSMKFSFPRNDVHSMKNLLGRGKSLSEIFQWIYPKIHLISLFSSSFIEEEHQIWYYFLSTMILIRCLERKSLFDVMELFFVRLIRSWNQTGNKFLNQPDVKQYLLK